MSGPNAPPMNGPRMPPPGMTKKPMGADRVPMSNEPLQRSPMAQAILQSIANRAGPPTKNIPLPMRRPLPDPRDIDIIMQMPTDTNVEAFDQKYGDGAAAKIIGDPNSEEAAASRNRTGTSTDETSDSDSESEGWRAIEADKNQAAFNAREAARAATPSGRLLPTQPYDIRYEKLPKRGKGRPPSQTVNESAKGDPAVAMANKTIDEAGSKPPSKAPTTPADEEEE